jgi:hypothetical protein
VPLVLLTSIPQHAEGATVPTSHPAAKPLRPAVLLETLVDVVGRSLPRRDNVANFRRRD